MGSTSLHANRTHALRVERDEDVIRSIQRFLEEAQVYQAVVLVCDHQGLAGEEVCGWRNRQLWHSRECVHEKTGQVNLYLIEA